MIDSFHFLRPWWLLILIPVAVIIWITLRRQDSTRAWQRFMDPHLLKALSSGAGKKKRLSPVALLAVILTLGAVAISGPTWSLEPSPFAEDQAALVIVLKVTPSMDEQDIQPSRAERAVQKIQDLLKQRSGARTALIAYAGSAHLVMPLTRDAGIINTFAADLSPAVMPSDGDAAAEAYALAGKELQRAGAAGSILMITDSLHGATSMDDVQVLGMAGVDALKPLEASVRTSGAQFTPVSIDDEDINQLSQRIDTSFAARPSDQGARWLDQGWWLTPVIAFFTLWWFRPGWVIDWG